MEVVLLGTSAALPTVRRWPAAVAVVREGEVLLFDCGEGTQVQFQKARLSPGKLSHIFISHLHGDHFYGLIGLLTSLQLSGRDKELNLYGPAGLVKYLHFMCKLSQFTFAYPLHVHEFENAEVKEVWDLGDYTVRFKPLKHKIAAYGFCLEEKTRPGKFDAAAASELGIPVGPERGRLLRGESITLPDGTRVTPAQVVGPGRPGKKIAICTDTEFCENAIALAAGAEVLIHEGTFGHDKEERAAATGHSTVTQAAQVARTAAVKRLILTHISARYDHGQERDLLAQAQAIFPETILAEDLMRIEF